MTALAEAQMSGVWFNRSTVEEAEYKYQEYLTETTGGKVAQQIAEARKQIQETLKSSSSAASTSGDSQDIDFLRKQIENMSKENEDLRKLVTQLTTRFQKIEARLTAVESGAAPASSASKQKPEVDAEDDDDVDLFGSDSEDEEELERLKAERVAAYQERKSKKKAVIAKSNIILDVKPWDDETDMKELERSVRSIKADGLLWGTSKLVKVAFGIMKLQIGCVVEDDKIGTDFLEEEITNFEDYVQSVDIVAFNKI